MQSEEAAAVNAVEPKSPFADLNARRDAELGPKFPMGLTSANLCSVLVVFVSWSVYTLIQFSAKY